MTGNKVLPSRADLTLHLELRRSFVLHFVLQKQRLEVESLGTNVAYVASRFGVVEFDVILENVTRFVTAKSKISSSRIHPTKTKELTFYHNARISNSDCPNPRGPACAVCICTP